MRRLSPAAVAAVAALAATALLAPLVLAKGEGTVTLAVPLPRDAEPGSVIKVTWTATVAEPLGDHPITGAPMFVRLIGVGEVTEAPGLERSPGTYEADVVVPGGGIRSAEFGLRGTTTYPDGRTERSDMLFRVEGGLLTDAPLPVPAADPAQPRAAAGADHAPAPSASEAAAPDVRLALALALSVAALAAAGLVARRRASAHPV